MVAKAEKKTTLHALNTMANIFIKDESTHPSGSYKWRSLQTIKDLMANEMRDGIFVESTGNLGITVSMIGKAINCPVYVAFRGEMSESKKRAIIDNDGSPVNLETLTQATLFNFQSRCLHVTPSSECFLASYRSIFEEIQKDFTDQPTIYVPIGTGTLLSSALMTPGIDSSRIIGVQVGPSFSLDDDLLIDKKKYCDEAKCDALVLPIPERNEEAISEAGRRIITMPPTFIKASFDSSNIGNVRRYENSSLVALSAALHDELCHTKFKCVLGTGSNR